MVTILDALCIGACAATCLSNLYSVSVASLFQLTLEKRMRGMSIHTSFYWKDNYIL